ncbi:MAG: nucleoside-diphosphate kinase [Phycisphaerae bacterium]|nr:nucleoside-diphosphate kinase [Phycisphaerae bacterium]
MERTLIILKPDALQRHLIGDIIARFDRKGLQVLGLKLMKIPKELAETHYDAHKERPFFPGLVHFMTSSPVIVIALAGKDAINVARKLIGATNSAKAEPGTIRGDFGMSGSFNLVHGSDSPESAMRELTLFFKNDEIIDWAPSTQGWVYDMSKGAPQ